MIKVMIVVYGLVLFVPQGVRNETTSPMARKMTILFADAGALGEGMAHEPRMWVVRKVETEVDGGLVVEWRPVAIELPDPPGAQVAVSFTGKEDGEIALGARWFFPQIDWLHPGETVKEVCLNNQPLCRKGNEDLVRGTAKVTGEWTTRPAAVCDDAISLPVRFTDQATFSYRKLANTRRRHDDQDPPFRLATALALETTVDSPAELETILAINGDEVENLLVTDQATCEKWIPKGPDETIEKCALVILGNPPEKPEVCKWVSCDPGFDGACIDGRYSSCPLDHHFEAFHHLTTAVNPSQGWVPYVDEYPDCPTQGVPLPMTLDDVWDVDGGCDPAEIACRRHTQPSPRCPPAFGDP